MVDLYLDNIGEELRTSLLDEYANQKKPTDGEIYRNIRQYEGEDNEVFRERWFARLSSSNQDRLDQLDSKGNRRLRSQISTNIRIAEEDNDREHRELNVMKKLASIHPRPPYVMHVVDDFDLEGPNGTHRCLVFELLGPSVPDTIDARFSDGRLSGKLAKTIAKQVVSELEFLHQEKIGHGDLHTRNLAFTILSMDNVSDKEFIETLGKPELGHVQRSDGKALEPGIPEYIVRPTGTHSWPLSNIIKIVDFGESFLQQTSLKRFTHR